jgi:ABC-type multidrug transport system fused ATPase/permease subunit
MFIENKDCFIIRFDESLFSKLIDNASSSFVLSFDSIFSVMFAFVSLFFVFIVLASSSRASRFRKKARESFSSTSQKRSRQTNNHCDCTLLSKCLDDLKNARCVKSVKRTEHFLSELYYLNRQICKRHINQLRQLFELLSIENLVEMKEVLWQFLKFDERIEIFKIERSNLFEAFEDND